MRLAGIDGCRAGWLCVAECDSHPVVFLAAHLAPWLEAFQPQLAVIDMPIGLPDAGPRRCDVLARQALRPPRTSSLFPAPVRGVLHQPTYAAACAAHRALDGRALSKQTWFLLPKIREVDRLLQEGAAWRPVLHEGHPELSFATWRGGLPMSLSKKTVAGREERARCVASHWPTLLDEARAALPRAGWSDDDLLDACALLWTARRRAAGTAHVRPDPADRDATGLTMAIVS